MEKLFKLREWLTVGDTARHLSIAFGEAVGEADVLRLALDRRLTLSVRFVNGTLAVRGALTRGAETPQTHSAAEPVAVATKGIPLFAVFTGQSALKAVQPDIGSLGEDAAVDWENEVSTIFDVWDLPMIGNERFDIERRYHALCGGPAVTLTCWEGTFVERPGWLCWLQDRRDLKSLPGVVAPGQGGSVSGPASSLPSDGVLVVRTTALAEFEAHVSNDSTPASVDRPLDTKERATLLTIIAALLKKATIDRKTPRLGKIIAGLVADIGASVAERTIDGYLKEMEDAVERKSKISN